METALHWSRLAIMTEEPQVTAVDPDVQLMIRFQEGDLEAFDALFARHVHSVVNFAYRFVRNRDVAEELAQEVFLRVHDAAPTYRPRAKFRTWLYRIATNICLNEIRRPQFRARHESIQGAKEDEVGGIPMKCVDRNAAGPDVVMERRAIAAALKNALARLPEKQRVAFILNKYQDLSYAEVAEVMATSEKSVKSLIHRAKEAMAEHLRPLLPELISL
jgi:RNA polymerase sigma-70 factor (ECF subfamily)